MSTIRFELRKEKIDKDNNAPIRIIYQINGARKYYTTGEKVGVDNWSEKEQCCVYYKVDDKGKKHRGRMMETEIKKINNQLHDLKRAIEKIENRFEANSIVYSVEMVIDELITSKKPTVKKDGSSKELFAFIDRYISDNEPTRVKGSLTVYKSLKSHLRAYESKTRKRITFDKIDYAFFQSFQNYLVGLTKIINNKSIGNPKTVKPKTVKALNNITIAKQLSTLKTFLNYAKAQGIEVSNKYSTFKIKRESDLEVISLTRKEFETLYSMNLSERPSWDQVRDVFIFSCATGLRYSDLNQLRREHIKSDYIDLTAIKTSHKTKVPLNPYSKAILKKYAGAVRPLPVISNQRSNEHLCKICKEAGINEKIEIVRKHGAHREVTVYPKYELIRMHCGRKTFATLSLENGMPAEQVMKIGGWKDYKSFKRYMNLTDDSTMKAMGEAWGRIIKPKLKAV